MFKKILVALDHSKADNVLLPQIRELAMLTHAEVLLLHVSTGWAAQWQDNLNLSDSQEIKEDRQYLESVAQTLRGEGFSVTTRHDRGEPAQAISENCAPRGLRPHRHGGPRTQIDCGPDPRNYHH